MACYPAVTAAIIALMIRFQCKSCGCRIKAANEDAGKKLKCPKCIEPLVVPVPLHVAMRTRIHRPHKKPPLVPKHRIKTSKVQPQSHVLPNLQEDTDPPALGLTDLRFTEATLFAMSLAFIVLYAVARDMRSDLHTFVSRLCAGNPWATSLGVIFLFLPFFAGLVLSVFHAFSTRQKAFPEKATMLFFAVAISAATGLYAGWLILKAATHVLWSIVALWNLIYAGLLILKFQHVIVEDELDGDYVSDTDATLGEIILSSISVIIILLACHRWFDLPWAITYSVCIAYITSFDRALRKVCLHR